MKRKRRNELEKAGRRAGYGTVCCAAALSACLSVGCGNGTPLQNGPSAVSTEQEQSGQAAAEQPVQESGPTTQPAQESQLTEQSAQVLQPQGETAAELPAREARTPQSQPEPAEQPPAGNAQTGVGLEQAKSAALAHAGLEASNVTFIKEEQDYDDGRLEYDIEFVTAETKYEYEIAADDGTILKSSKELIGQRTGVVQSAGGITQEEAKKAALDYAGLNEDQAVFSKVEQDYDDGIAEYEIEFYADKKEYSFSISAATGEILEVEIDRD
ncbi:MAG: PepSY domain-containing protein [Blautia sp.]|nr:PepSY domain-containing protein [Blautia sp.]